MCFYFDQTACLVTLSMEAGEARQVYIAVMQIFDFFFWQNRLPIVTYIGPKLKHCWFAQTPTPNFKLGGGENILF